MASLLILACGAVLFYVCNRFQPNAHWAVKACFILAFCFDAWVMR